MRGGTQLSVGEASRQRGMEGRGQEGCYVSLSSFPLGSPDCHFLRGHTGAQLQPSIWPALVEGCGTGSPSELQNSMEGKKV